MLECLPNDYQMPEQLKFLFMSSTIANRQNTCGVILAGGQGRRMNYEDKGLLGWKGRMLIEYVIDTLQPQLNKLVISANQHHDQYQQFNYPVISDQIENFQGPLAGIYSAMQYCSEADYLLVLPCDCPTPPDDLFARLSDALSLSENKNIAIVDDGQRTQPLFGLYKTSLLPVLEAALKKNHNKVMQFISDNGTVSVNYSDQADAFRNFNRPEDMQ